MQTHTLLTLHTRIHHCYITTLPSLNKSHSLEISNRKQLHRVCWLLSEADNDGSVVHNNAFAYMFDQIICVVVCVDGQQ